MPGTKIVDVGGLSFAVTDEGDGPAVLLLHGFPDSRHLWRNQIPALTSAGFRVIAPDQRGFGESAKPEGVENYSLHHVISDAKGILDSLGIERAHVVGHDWGAAVAWLFATYVPERVGKLVAISVGHPASLQRRPAKQLMKFWYAFMFQFEGVAEEAIARHDWELLRAWSASAPDIDRYIADLSRPGALTAGLNWYRANLTPQILLADAPAMPAVQTDVMGVWGARDLALTEEQMTASSKLVGGTWRYERFDDAGHWLQLEQPERLNAVLLDFLS